MSSGFLQTVGQSFQDPIQAVNQLAPLLTLFAAARQRQNQRNNPQLLALVNTLVRQQNANNAVGPGGQQRAGDPYGDAASGYGGAFGTDRNGNPLSAMQGYTKYAIGQAAGSGFGFNQQQQALNQLAARTGGGQLLGQQHLMVPQGGLSGLDPNAVQGTVQSARAPGVPIPEVEPARGVFGLRSYDVGVTSVPQTGPALLHEGEMVVPKAMNPAAGMPAQPLAPRSAPMQGLGAPMGSAAPASGPNVQLGGNYAAMTPGLSAGVQQQIIARGQDAINQQFQGAARNIRNDAGSAFAGTTAQQLFDANVARVGQGAGLARDVGIQAAQDEFAQRLAGNQFELQRAQANAQTGLANYEQGLNAELGRGNLALQRNLGQGNLDVARGNLALQQQLGTGNLALQRQLGMGNLALGQTQAANQFNLGQQQVNLDRTLGMGNLALGQTQASNNYNLGLQNIGLNRELGQGGLQNDRYGLETQRQLGNRGFDINTQQFNDQYARQLYQDNLDNQRWWTGRNDNLMASLYGNANQQTQNQNSLYDLLGPLLSAFA